MPERYSGILLGGKTVEGGAKVPAKKTEKKTAKKPKTKSAKKPVNKPTEKPAAKPTEKPAAKPAKKPAAKPTEKPAARATTNKKTRPTIKVSGDLLVASSAEYSILFDFYGNLLGDRQKDIFALYHEDNLSLSEISKDLGISRQAVHEALKKAETSLKETEKKLALVQRHEEFTYALRSAESDEQKLREDISSVGLDKKDSERMKRKLRKMMKTIKEMDI